MYAERAPGAKDQCHISLLGFTDYCDQKEQYF